MNQTREGKIETILFVQVKQNEGSNIRNENKGTHIKYWETMEEKTTKMLIETQ